MLVGTSTTGRKHSGPQVLIGSPWQHQFIRTNNPLNDAPFLKKQDNASFIRILSPSQMDKFLWSTHLKLLQPATKLRARYYSSNIHSLELTLLGSRSLELPGNGQLATSEGWDMATSHSVHECTEAVEGGAGGPWKVLRGIWGKTAVFPHLITSSWWSVLFLFFPMMWPERPRTPKNRLIFLLPLKCWLQCVGFGPPEDRGIITVGQGDRSSPRTSVFEVFPKPSEKNKIKFWFKNDGIHSGCINSLCGHFSGFTDFLSMKTEVRFVSYERVLKQVIGHSPQMTGPAWCKAQSTGLSL